MMATTMSERSLEGKAIRRVGFYAACTESYRVHGHVPVGAKPVSGGLHTLLR